MLYWNHYIDCFKHKVSIMVIYVKNYIWKSRKFLLHCPFNWPWPPPATRSSQETRSWLWRQTNKIKQIIHLRQDIFDKYRTGSFFFKIQHIWFCKMFANSQRYVLIIWLNEVTESHLFFQYCLIDWKSSHVVQHHI